MLPINDGAILTKDVTGLEKFAEYEFKVLAFTYLGDGPNSSVKFERTKEDVLSRAPTNFSVAALSSTSIKASWQLPPENSRHGIIKGFTLYYREKYHAGSFTMLPINDSAIITKDATGLKKYTEYEFKVLAFTSVGDGPKSSVNVERTKEDAPSAPSSFSHIDIAPRKSHGPKINLTWSAPVKANGIIRSYTVFYNHSGDTQKELSGIGALSYSVDVLGGVTFQFLVRAVTIKPGLNASLTVHTKEYEPSVGPDTVSFSEVNKTTFIISWAPLTREQSYGKVILYDVKEELLSQGKRRKRSPRKNRTVNTTATFVFLHDLQLCSQYNVSVRAYTVIGPGPYGQPVNLVTSRAEAPWGLKATSRGTTHVSLEWKTPKSTIKGDLTYTVKYSGTKTYNTRFKDEGEKSAKTSTTYQVVDLVPGSNYRFEVYGTSVCGKGVSIYLDVETKMMAPIAPVVPKANVTDVSVSESSVDIYLWPAEQRNGPISAYQVIVMKVADGAKELPDDYASKLTDFNSANEKNLNFYLAAEIQNDPVHEKPWEFTVGDEETYGAYINEGLDRGEDYIVYQRAVTHVKDVILGGDVSEVAKIYIQKGKSVSQYTVVTIESQTLILQ